MTTCKGCGREMEAWDKEHGKPRVFHNLACSIAYRKKRNVWKKEVKNTPATAGVNDGGNEKERIL